ncbi:hypothetical protein NQ315_001826 [Exocentrus adspersus]|uniref:Putative inorganic phosphate cotransporter n=1 Tax=Exocentrus adspersus TaxID=1586481 RepID=A0AAV8W9S0_9CUCU|nr:hypothetical protein NQ315_001826 [Exocentrus adspersus]
MSTVIEKDKETVETSNSDTYGLGVRHLQCALLGIIVITIAGMRNILNVAVIAMVSDSPPNENIPTYPNWASKKNLMLSSFFWGYVVFQVLAGELAKKYGPKLLLGVSIFINSIFLLLLPYFGAQFGYLGVIACRVIQGLTQGPLQPCCHNLLSKWVPRQERARMGNFVYSGAPLGVLIALPTAGAISSSSVGWPVVFYLYGSIGILWTILWFVFGSESPSVSKMISEEEKRYIQKSTSVHEEKTVPTPWKAIFTSAPVYAILICHCGQNWGYFTMITETPSYMDKILDFNLASNSALSALPYLAQWIVSHLLSPIADLLILRQVVSVGSSRKLMNSIGTLVPAVALISLMFLGSDQPALTLVIIVIAVGVNGGTYCGFNINHMDISPTHAGTLMGIGNTIGNSQKQLWNIVFVTTGIVYVITGVMYILLGSGEEQPWNKLEDRDELPFQDRKTNSTLAEIKTKE